MNISKTPYRISFFGGGTDYPAWYLQEEGAVLSTTIDKYCWITARYLPPFFNNKHRIVWSHIETVSSISEILHPAVREGLRFLGFDDKIGVEIHHQGDLPARSGIGSSSSFTVGLIKVLLALRGETLSKHELAVKAIALEQDALKECVGSQDQVAAAYGGFNVIHFGRDGAITAEPVAVSPHRLAELQSSLLLFYLGTTRLASEIAGTVIENLAAKRAALCEMRDMVDVAVDILTGHGPVDEFGRLLDETWRHKRSLAPAVTNQLLDDIYETAKAHGALGGKVLGAGGAGFMLFFVAPERQPAVRQALGRWWHVPFRFERDGCTLIESAGGSSEG